MTLFDRNALYELLRKRDGSCCADEIRSLCEDRFFPAKHGNLDKWKRAWKQLPDGPDVTLDSRGDVVKVLGNCSETQREDLRETLKMFHPWRKGPFEVLGIPIDTEWRSNWKWDRIGSAIDLRGQSVLDVGCGNGYYGWKMLEAGAEWVLGCDPYLLYVMQFEVIRRFAPMPERHFVVPLTDTELPKSLGAFDTTFSMGVLYHRTSPIDHLQTLAETLRPGGQLVLETLVVDSCKPEVLVPTGRYAKMRNVWFIPSVPMLSCWLTRCGYVDVQCIDITLTTSDEQRRTDWMTFESLADFLDPDDASRTVEGHPAPLRAIVTATKR
ncbi:tRNA 5-methoxyuridine(34)/uridine 5-oxyacetic acid(34) synthase CmoB [Novipirellula artificiosorum]|uniref:tRNA (Mo5U34)-methyltransferase n=1 Tax=Novipirellula artificiosorum TaxID=2528016 RepID=A0A5C6DI20_9BACT|nr:tRNA 5-methoxyuridine(34)/uridine 5-oxyacetic acid(34) synthase CmoB [Novipirellula artificiosorum]TWU35845.1 tRNA (mo5U34)-methyltransferase [Novipirellula artificiosorum]